MSASSSHVRAIRRCDSDKFLLHKPIFSQHKLPFTQWQLHLIVFQTFLLLVQSSLKFHQFEILLILSFVLQMTVSHTFDLLIITEHLRSYWLIISNLEVNVVLSLSSSNTHHVSRCVVFGHMVQIILNSFLVGLK